MKEKEIKQRMIFMCDLPIGKYSEFSGLHPCVIASVDLRNNYSPNIYIFPITHATKKWQPTHHILKKETYDFFTYDINTVICEEGRSISRNRIQGYVGDIEQEDFNKILKCKDFIFYSKVDGVPFKNIDIGDTFLYNGDCYVKIIWKKDKYNIAMNLDILECREFEDYDVVNATWNIVESLQYKSNQVKEWFKEKVDISNENIGM